MRQEIREHGGNLSKMHRSGVTASLNAQADFDKAEACRLERRTVTFYHAFAIGSLG